MLLELYMSIDLHTAGSQNILALEEVNILGQRHSFNIQLTIGVLPLPTSGLDLQGTPHQCNVCTGMSRVHR
jgi:hypothetical protein